MERRSTTRFLGYAEAAVDAYRKQIGAEPDEETERQLRTQVWNMLVQQTLVDKELNRLNITVTDDEVREIILLGPNPPQMIANPVY